ncbi:glucosaminidase domain-containing protein [Bacteroides acidifaciens]|uniref:glucosaminidase domain-containing protein n=1 Tax=Bacteroides acidifaciens TaxID=85831 RepID=UPI0025AE4936|nr:glucosaminidase domain-containing protein [Bacteroides acidifaciens]
MHNTILTALLLFLSVFQMSAQFYTITKECAISVLQKAIIMDNIDNKEDSVSDIVVADTVLIKVPEKENCLSNIPNDQKSDDSVSRCQRQRIEHSASTDNLPELTIPNLLAEIKKNNIKYPKIVLAQAILETGWFKSSVCRNKHNLFGLTNPRTGKYYEFNHWTESVAAYYSKVQYRYSGGNYLLWLRDIGYAEDKGYIRAIIKLLKVLKPL